MYTTSFIAFIRSWQEVISSIQVIGLLIQSEWAGLIRLRLLVPIAYAMWPAHSDWINRPITMLEVHLLLILKVYLKASTYFCQEENLMYLWFYLGTFLYLFELLLK